MKKLILLSILALNFASAQSQASGDNFFESDIVHEVRLTFDQVAYWDSLTDWKTYADLTGENVYILADAEVDGQAYDSIGVRFKGNSSYQGYPGDKKPFKLKFNEYVSGQKLDGLKKLTLNNGFNDPTMLREKLLLDYSRKHEVAAPRCTFSRLYLNNVYWGLYSVVEQVDKTFLGDFFPENDGNLFKGDPMARLIWEGPTESNYYDNLELKTNESANDWADMVHFIDLLNNSTGADFEDSLASVLNTPDFLRNHALNMLFVSLDSYVGVGHNFYLYHNLNSDKFEWISWDVNGCFGLFNIGMSISQLKNLSLLYMRPPVTERPLLNNILNDANLKDEYLNYVADFLSLDFDTTTFFPLIDSLANKIRSDLYADNKKMFSNSEFEDNIEYTFVSRGNRDIVALKDLLAGRIPQMIDQLAGFGIVLGKENLSQEGFVLYPNPTIEKVKLKFEGIQETLSVSIFDLYGAELKKLNFAGVKDAEVTLPSAKGLYLVRVNNGIKSVSVKVLKE